MCLRGTDTKHKARTHAHSLTHRKKGWMSSRADELCVYVFLQQKSQEVKTLSSVLSRQVLREREVVEIFTSSNTSIPIFCSLFLLHPPPTSLHLITSTTSLSLSLSFILDFWVLCTLLSSLNLCYCHDKNDSNVRDFYSFSFSFSFFLSPRCFIV